MKWTKTTEGLPPIDESNEWRFDREISIEVWVKDDTLRKRKARYYYLSAEWLPIAYIGHPITHWAIIEPPTE